MKTIGFGGTFYTLWDIEAYTEQVSEGVSYNVVRATYYKNLSKDFEEAKIKAGTSNYDECLQGKKRSFQYSTKVISPKEMTDCEKLFRVIFVNDNEHLVDGVRKDAFDRCLELGYISEVNGNFQKWLEFEEKPKTDNVAYKFNHPVRSDDSWYSNTLNKFFIGII